MAQDAFFRNVNIDNMTIGELKAKLVESVAPEKKERSDDNTNQLKRLNNNIEKIIGQELKKELAELNKLVKQTKQHYDAARIKQGESRKTSKQLNDMMDAAAAFATSVDYMKKSFDEISNFNKELKKANKVVQDLGNVKIGELHGEAMPISRKGNAGAKQKTIVMAGNDDLCSCICECFGDYLEQVIKLINKDFALEKKNFSLNKNNAKTVAQAGALGKMLGGKGAPADKTKKLKTKETESYLAMGGVADVLQSDKPLETAVTKIVPKLGTAIGNIFAKLSPTLGGIADGLINLILKPLTDELDHQEKITRTIFTQTGMDAEETIDTVKKLQVTLKDVAETGQSYTAIQKQQLKNTSRGIKGEKELKKVTNIGLQTVTQIGVSAEQAGDLFADWKLKLGADNQQLYLMKNGLLDIVKTTGLFGDHLFKVVESSKKFTENMRLSGTFTAKAANNLTGLLAEAEKRGVGKGMENLLEVLQGSLLGEGGDEKSRMLALAGIGGSEKVRSRLITGTILQDRAAQRVFAANLRKQFNSIIENAFGKGKTIEDLTIEEKGFISPQFKRLFGKDIQELDIMIDVFAERGKTFADKLTDINNSTISEKKKAMSQEALIQQTSDEILEDFTRALKKAKGNVSKAFSDVSESSEDLAALLEKIGAKDKKGAEAIGEILKKRAAGVITQAKELGMEGELKEGVKIDDEAINKALKDLEGNDKKGYLAVVERIQELSALARMQAEKKNNPAYEANLELKKIDASIRQELAGKVIKFLPKINKTLGDVLAWLQENLPNIFGGIGKVGGFIAEHPYITALIAGFTLLTATLTGGGGLISGIIGLGGAITTALTGPLGIVAALVVGGVLIKNALDGWEKEFKNQAMAMRDQGNALQREADKSVNSAKEKAKWSDLQIMEEKKALEAKKAAIASAKNTLGGGTAVGAKLIPGVSEAEDEAINLVRKAENEFKAREASMAAAEALRKGATAAEAKKIEVASLVERGGTKYKSHEEIALATSQKEIIEKWNKEVSILTDQVKKAQEVESEQWRLRKGTARIFGQRTTGEEKYIESQERADTAKQALQFALKDFFKKEGTDRDLYLGEAANKSRAFVKDVDKAALDQFKAASSVEEMEKILDQQRKALQASWNATDSSVEGLSKALEIAQQHAKNINAFEQARSELQAKKEAEAKAIAPRADVVASTTMPVPTEEEIRRKKAEQENAAKTEVGKIEANTKETADNSRMAVTMLRQIRNALAKLAARRGSGLIGEPEGPDTIFYDEVLNTEWPNARQGRTVGLEFDLTDFYT